MRNVRMVEYEKGKYQILGEVEIGDTGEAELRILATRMSKKKAHELLASIEGREASSNSKRTRKYRGE